MKYRGLVLAIVAVAWSVQTRPRAASPSSGSRGAKGATFSAVVVDAKRLPDGGVHRP